MKLLKLSDRPTGTISGDYMEFLDFVCTGANLFAY